MKPIRIECSYCKAISLISDIMYNHDIEDKALDDVLEMWECKCKYVFTCYQCKQLTLIKYRRNEYDGNYDEFCEKCKKEYRESQGNSGIKTRLSKKVVDSK